MAPASQAAQASEGRAGSLGIMQPYFFPYLGYFQLIDSVDDWIVFDTAQYIRHGWVNRNRVLHPNEGWQYVMAPIVKAPRETPIREIEVRDVAGAGDRIRAQLQHYKKRAPAESFQGTMELLDAAFETDDQSLSRLNVRILGLCCERLGIPFECRFFSEMNVDVGEVDGPGGWAPAISAAVGAHTYVNAPGGEELFRSEDFTDRGVTLKFLEPSVREYRQGRRPFEAGLSILDVFLWNSNEEARELLEGYSVR